MRLANLRHPRQFSYRPKYTKSGGDGKIQFRRITRFDPHSHKRKPVLLFGLLLLIMAIIYIIGGFKPASSPPQLTPDDAAHGGSKATELLWQ